MSIFAWLTRPHKTPQPPARTPPPPARASAPAPAAAASSASATPATRTERNQRRELLYTAVRDTMVRAGVLSAGYKFKVLSLDQRGEQFLVMIDVAQEYGNDSLRLSEIESQVIRLAKTRFSIGVSAVYWRIQRLEAPLAAGITPRPVTTPPVATPALTPSTPAARPAVTPPARPHAPAKPLLPVQAPPPPAEVSEKHVTDDEMRAFEQALASVSSARTTTPNPAPTPGVAVRSGPRQAPPALTGFEDTVLPEQDTRPSDLGATQYGELK